MAIFCAAIAILSIVTNAVLCLVIGVRMARLAQQMHRVQEIIDTILATRPLSAPPGYAPPYSRAQPPPLEVGDLWGDEVKEEPWKPPDPMPMDEIDE